MKTSDFDNLISTESLVLIDFYATWCGACGAIDDALDRVVLSMGDIVTLVRIDTTSRTSFDLVRRYNVVALPTLMLFSRGKVLWRECGLITYERLAGVVRRYRTSQLF
jgi:thioredoxin 1